MLNAEICKLRDKLNESIVTGKDYSVIYQSSIEEMFLSSNRWHDSYHIKNLVIKCPVGQFYSLAA